MENRNRPETEWIETYMRNCTLCPRNCHADRTSGRTGYCGQTDEITLARAALHFWEEPCISGVSGSGTVFFSGCNMKCIFCQNHEIALGDSGRRISPERLPAIFLELQGKGANNINLVTPTHFIPQICIALEKARTCGLSIPVIYNTSCYESVSSLRLLDGLVDIYLPDFKYFSPELSAKYSNAPDYFEAAAPALEEMVRQTGTPLFGRHDPTDIQIPILTKGVIVRHLLLPGETKDSKKILRFLHETYHNDIYISIMNQYTPMHQVADIPQLNRCVTDEEYKKVLLFSERIGIENGFIQEGKTSEASFIPPFNYEGL